MQLLRNFFAHDGVTNKQSVPPTRVLLHDVLMGRMIPIDTAKTLVEVGCFFSRNDCSYSSTAVGYARRLANLCGRLTSRLVVRASHDAGNEGYGNDAAAHDLEKRAVRETVASGHGLKQKKY